MIRAFRSFLAATAAAALLSGCGRPPQIGDDPGVFKAVDALYTAVSLRDRAQVERVAGRLQAMKAARTLPAGAAGALEAIVAEANAGGWEPAQARLAAFMEGQRR